MEITKSMMIYKSDWYNQETFKMLPVSEDCPFNEVVYDPQNGFLAVVGKNIKEKPQMLPKLNDKGDIMMKKVPDGKGVPYIEERRIMDAYSEYYLIDKEDIRSFIKTFAINPEHSMLEVLDKKILEKEVLDEATATGY